jgi:predicted GIY-YIG superfamily endonuclease
MKFFYVYILQSGLDERRFYTGFTEDLQARLKKHNAGDFGLRSELRVGK